MRTSGTWINGRAARRIDAGDRGLQYGDGVFETMRIRRRAVRLLDEHLRRLGDACERLAIAAPAPALLRRELERVAAPHEDGILKLILTRGVGKRGYRPTGREHCTRILTLHPAPPGGRLPPWRLRICRTRLGSNPVLAGLKTLNRLECVLARAEWSDARIAEGLMLDGEDNVVCGTMSNLFIIRGSLLITPLLDRCGVAGVMRGWILQTAPRLGLTTVERRVRLADMMHAQEVFMSNAVTGPVPVAGIRHRAGTLRYAAAGVAAALRARLELL